jgi:hypothetical protein
MVSIGELVVFDSRGDCQVHKAMIHFVERKFDELIGLPHPEEKDANMPGTR